jgi:hypothetical protein
MSRKSKQEVNRLIAEFRRSPQGQRWQEWHQRFERPSELPTLPTLADNPTYQRLGELVQKYEASPSRQALTELMQRFQEIELDEEIEPPQQLPQQGGRPKKLTPEQIEAGINFLNSKAKMQPKLACEALINELKLRVSDSTLIRHIVSKAWRG